MYYRDLSVTSYTDPLTEIDSVRIVSSNDELLVRRQTEEEREERGVFATEFQIKEPVDTACYSVYLEQYIFSYLTELSRAERGGGQAGGPCEIRPCRRR